MVKMPPIEALQSSGTKMSPKIDVGTDPQQQIRPEKTKFSMIVKKNDSFVVLSKEGKNLGKYKTRKEAEKRLKQVEFFKNKR